MSAGAPFGSYVDYMLDENGWPVMLLSTQSLHTQNIDYNPSVSLFCQLPRTSATSAAALSRVTVMGIVEPVPLDDLSVLKLAFTLIHQYSEQIVDSPRFSFYRIKPEKIFFAGGFGVQSTWVDVEEYVKSRPDVMAAETPIVLAKVNTEKQAELNLLCKHFLRLEGVTDVRIQAIDRLGIDLRVKTGIYTDEYRIGFRYQVNSAEDAKSEMFKLFQEAWERENGYCFTDSLPPHTKYAEDILRHDRKTQ
jgi:putative heme iron utilization protein